MTLREQYEKENPEKQLVAVCHHVAAFTDEYVEWLESKLLDVMPCPPDWKGCDSCKYVLIEIRSHGELRCQRFDIFMTHQLVDETTSCIHHSERKEEG